MTVTNAFQQSVKMRFLGAVMPLAGILFALCAFATALFLLCGCVSSRPSQHHKIHIVVSSSGAISVEGKPCRLSEVSKKLKKLGATPQTSIAIAVPASGADAVMKTLTRDLASAGFRHFVFVKPREIDASVSPTQRRQQGTKRAP